MCSKIKVKAVYVKILPTNTTARYFEIGAYCNIALYSSICCRRHQPAADVPGNGPSDQKRGAIRDISTI
ncbi:DUF2733 domain-containing protein [Rhodobacteraceae bacterium IMCC15231]|nr:DUF2733 domain-containing protein [Rhodobacteraceae bacterium IMCC15231]